MQDEVVISVEDLKKEFKVYYDKSNSAKEKILFWKRNRYERKKVLQGVSFDIRKGEAIGLIGRNGCGKSTTLKLLTKIIYPTSGKLVTKGRVSSLIELGAGFHPDMSGRENIYINASIFGLTKKEIDERMDTIIEFSELGKVVDNPVRTYSSGMYMRLAFSVAINVKADILLIDEILAVGDVSFQKKCFNKLKQIKESGTTVVIVSHSLAQIEKICDRTIWIEGGHIQMDGTPKNVHKEYQAFMEAERLKKGGDALASDGTFSYFHGRRVERKGKGAFRFLEESFLSGMENQPKGEFSPGEDIVFQGFFENHSDFFLFYFGFRIYTDADELCFGSDTLIETNGKMISVKNKKMVEIRFKAPQLLPGRYYLDIDAFSEDGLLQDSIHEAFFFEVKGSQERKGMVDIAAEIKVE